MKTKPTISVTDPFLSTIVVKTIFSSIILVFTLLLFISCKNDAPKSEITLTTTKAKEKVHVAFAGGGWRAHTGHSAWTVSLLDNGSNKLKDVFSNVGTISSNSGGSWFSTMLMFSDSFVSDIEAENAVNTWTTTSGWIGKQRKHFDAAPCDYVPEGVYLECVFDHYTNTYITGGTYWKLMVEKLVYKDYPLGLNTLSSARRPWAVGKSLLLASTLLKNTVVLNKVDWELYHRYYQACIDPIYPTLNGDSGSGCGSGYQIDVTPVTFSSLPKDSSFIPSPFLAELGVTGNSSSLHLGYTKDFYDTAPKDTATINLPLINDNVPIMTAASASSAALGFAASERITGVFGLSYTFSEDAVSFGLANSKVQYVDATGLKLQELASKKVVRLADGGALDNSGIIQLVRSLQLNDQEKDFNIIAFDNITSLYNGENAETYVGVDIASLFGYPNKLCFDIKVTKYCINLPSVQIFEKQTLSKSDTIWTHGTNGGNQLIYTKYKIKTKENTTMGVTEGTNGTLHVFTCVYPNAVTAPIDGDTNFDAYEAMFKFINSGLNNKKGEGLKHLQTALGF